MHNSTKAKTTSLMVLLVSVFLLSAFTGAKFVGKVSAAGYTEYTGTLGDADFAVRLPVSWNGMLIVFCRGYSPTPINATAGLAMFNAQVSELLNQGFAVAASGYGAVGFCIQKGVNSTYELTSYVIGTYHVTGKVFLWGNSMGGAVALLLGEKYPNLYSGVLDLYGVKDLKEQHNITAFAASIELETGGTPTTQPKAYEDRSPTYHANITIPVITMHGTSDTIVPFYQSTMYQTAVANTGHSNLYRLYSVPGEQHLSPAIAAQVSSRFAELVAWSDAINNSFSIMQISDTQHLPFLSPTLYNDTISWIVNNSAAYNLQMVVHTGDFVDAYQAPPLVAYNQSQKAQEWVVANAAMGKLLDAGIPYCWAAGNHDQDPFNNPNGTMMGSSYPAFNTTVMRAKSYWVDDIYDAKNTAVKFTYNNYPFVIINLEYLANSSAMAWMKSLLDKSVGVNTIVTTHDYLDINANYDATTGVWTKNLKATLDSYPSVFLALSGHNHGWNMTRAGNREEVLFDFQEENNKTGAAAIRIYTFNLVNKKVYTSTYCVDNKTWLTDAYNQFSFDASITSDWILTQDARAMKAYPDLKETVWVKNATMPPNGQYDKIGLHRLVKTGITPKGVVFLTNCPTWGMGETRISNPPNDTWTKYENYSQAIYWANRGFDVYAIDYRPHFAPQNLNASQMSFAANWGLDMWISDTKEAAEKVKEVSGSQRFFISGECTGGMVALDYAAKYWKTDLKGIILLDANFYVQGYPIVGKFRETNIYNLTAVVNDMNAKSNWTTSPYAALALSAAYALQNPGAPAEYPPGTPLTPTINPLTNKTWANITEWWTYGVQYNFGAASATSPAGMFSNLMGGYADVSQVEYLFSKTEFLPLRFLVESQAMIDWANCPYLPYDYNDHYSEIGVPILAFDTIFSNRTGALRFVNGISSTDLTGVYLTNYGHLDLYAGTYSARDVSERAYQWMLGRLSTLDVTARSSVTVMPGWTWWFFAQNLGGTGPYTYQWYEGLNPIQGQTSMVLPIMKNTPGVYSFYCRVTDKDGTTTTSNAVALTVLG